MTPGHLLKIIPSLEAVLKQKRVSLFLDYDGTLTPITGRPEDARLSFQMKDLLKTLLRLYPLSIISGRGLADLKSLVGIDGIVYAGNHGFEAVGPEYSMVFDSGSAAREEIKRLSESLKELPPRCRGVFVEDKGITLSIHYRLLDPRDKHFFTDRFLEITSGAVKKGLVRINESKKAFEVRPNVNWNKGRAVEWMLDREGFAGTTPFYLGDDETDRDGFKAVRGRGVSVYVGGVSQDADYYLEFQGEVRAFLEWLCHIRS